MDFVETKLAGCFLVQVKKIVDHRGYFARGFCRDEFANNHLNPNVTQLNIGFSTQRGTLRGMHYQEVPHAEAKLVRCTRGSIFDVVIDLRSESPTVGQWFGVELTAESGLMLYAPERFAHGYQTLADETEVYYLTSFPYAPAAARGVRYDDPAFAIKWPLPATVISDADRNWPDFRP